MKYEIFFTRYKYIFFHSFERGGGRNCLVMPGIHLHLNSKTSHFTLLLQLGEWSECVSSRWMTTMTPLLPMQDGEGNLHPHIIPKGENNQDYVKLSAKMFPFRLWLIFNVRSSFFVGLHLKSCHVWNNAWGISMCL